MQGCTALHYCAAQDCKNLVSLLVALGANVHIKCFGGEESQEVRNHINMCFTGLVDQLWWHAAVCIAAMVSVASAKLAIHFTNCCEVIYKTFFATLGLAYTYTIGSLQYITLYVVAGVIYIALLMTAAPDLSLRVTWMYWLTGATLLITITEPCVAGLLRGGHARQDSADAGHRYRSS